MTTNVVDARSSITRISPTKSVYYTVVSSLNQHVSPTALKHVFNDAAVSAVTVIPRIWAPISVGTSSTVSTPGVHYNMRSIKNYTNVFRLHELVRQLQFCLASLRTSSCDFFDSPMQK